MIDATSAYADITADNVQKAPSCQEENVSDISVLDEAKEPLKEPVSGKNISDSNQLTEQHFFNWLTSEGIVSDATAEQYISNIHSVEKLYKALFGIRCHIFGAPSAEYVMSTIEALTSRSEYIDANERRSNSFNYSLRKFAQFAGISADGLNVKPKKKYYKPPVSSQTVVKTVNFADFRSCTYCKPYSFILNEIRHPVGKWRVLYSEFLIRLYNDNNCSEIIKGLIGRALYGERIDFADKTLLDKLRRPIKISANFFCRRKPFCL